MRYLTSVAFLMIPVVANATPVPAPSPETDLGLASFVMVAGAAFLAAPPPPLKRQAERMSSDAQAGVSALALPRLRDRDVLLAFVLGVAIAVCWRGSATESSPNCPQTS